MKVYYIKFIFLFWPVLAGATTPDEVRKPLMELAQLRMDHAQARVAISDANAIQAEGAVFKGQWEPLATLEAYRYQIKIDIFDQRKLLTRLVGDDALVLELSVIKSIIEELIVARESVGLKTNLRLLREVIDQLQEDANRNAIKLKLTEKIMMDYNFLLLNNFREYPKGNIAAETESILTVDDLFKMFYFTFSYNEHGTKVSAKYRLKNMRKRRGLDFIKKLADLRKISKLAEKLDNSYQEQIVMGALLTKTPLKDVETVLPFIDNQQQVDYIFNYYRIILNYNTKISFKTLNLDNIKQLSDLDCDGLMKRK